MPPLSPNRVLAGVLIALYAFAATASAEETNPTADALRRLEAALAAFPDDPDLEWAYATTLSDGGHPDQAATRLQRFAKKWPDRRVDVDLQLGRALYDAGRVDDARVRLASAVRKQPRSGIARFYHGLALRELGRRQQARAELIRSGKLTPALFGDATLLISLDAFAEGDDEEGVRLAQEVIRFDPTSDAAARARMLLQEKDLAATQRAWRVDGYAGFEYDDNVTLESDRSGVEASDRDDFKGLWGAGAAWRHVFTDDVQGMAGYRFDQAVYHDETDFNYLNNAVHVGSMFRVHQRAALRLDLIGWNTRQDGDNYLWAGTARPAVLIALPHRWGLLRIFANGEYRDFDALPLDDSMEQDGWTVGGGAEWNTPLPRIKGTSAISVSFNETLTEADKTPSTLGEFKGDYDQGTLRVHHRMRIPLPLDFEFGSDLTYSRSWYRFDNFGSFLTEFFELPVDEIEVRRRRDHFVAARLFVSRPLHKYIRAELDYKPRRRFSNVDLYDYESHAVGLVFRIQSD